MARIEGQIVIDRPVEKVFDFVADQRNEPRYNPDMIRAEKTSAGPVGLGTRFHAETKTRRRTADMTIEITACERPRRLAHAIHLSNMDIRGTLLFDPVPGGTRMRWLWDVRPRGLLKLMGPMVTHMGQRQEQRIWKDLKHLLEAGGST
jgi:uncharacterized protein YndB with AHSA1/START domain